MSARRILTWTCLAALSAACSPPMPGGDAGPGDGGTSDVVANDGPGGGEGGASDGGALCNRVAIEDLGALGMRTGDAVRYTGSNMSANESPTVGPQSNAPIQAPSRVHFPASDQAVLPS